jgi:hypothetical protein
MLNRRKAILETPNRRTRRRKRLVRLFILYVLGFLILCIGIFYFFRISALQIKDVEISGAGKVDQSELRAIAEKFSEGNVAYFIPKHFFIFYPKKEIAKDVIEKYPEIISAKVVLRGLNKVELRIVERTPYAFYCTTSCYFADEQGFVYKEASSTDEHIIFRELRVLPEQSLIRTYPLSTETFKEVEGFARNISELNLHIKEIVIEVNGDLSVLTEEGKIIISFRESFSDQYSFLKTALSQKVFLYPDGSVRNFDYIDLRFGKKIFYKIEKSGQTTSTSAFDNI